jgi:PAS domain S-box-containing protein
MRNTLLRRTVLLVSFCTVISFAVLTFLIVKRERQLLLEQSSEILKTHALTITEVIKEGMMEGKTETVLEVLRLLEQASGASLEIYDDNGNRVFQKGRNINLPKELFEGKTYKKINSREMVFFIPLKNELRCQRCHTGSTLKGALVVRMPLERLNESVRGTERRMIIYGIWLLLASIILIFILIKYQIGEPLRRLLSGIKGLTEGKYEELPEDFSVEEFQTLIKAFNTMAGRLKEFHQNLESMVAAKTEELQKTADELKKVTEELSEQTRLLEWLSVLPHHTVRTDLPLGEGLKKYLEELRKSLRIKELHLYLVDRSKESLDFSVAVPTKTEEFGDEILKKILYSNEPLLLQKNGLYVFLVPLLTARRTLCWEINRCVNRDCPVYGKEETDCWTVFTTKCTEHNIYGCLRCEAFPVRGVMVGTTNNAVASYMKSIFKIVATQLSSIVELLYMIECDRKLLEYLEGLYDVTLKATLAKGVRELFTIIDSSAVKRLFDCIALWMLDKEGRPLLSLFSAGYNLDEIKLDNIINVCRTQANELYELHIKNIYSGIFFGLGFEKEPFGVIGFFKKEKGFIRPEEKTVALILAQQVSKALENIMLKEDLYRQNRELRFQKEFIETVIQSIHSGIIVTDSENRILKVNSYVVELTGLQENDLINKKLEEVLPDLVTLLGEEANEGYINIQGKTVYIGFNQFPYQGPERLRGKIILFRDLTEIIELRRQIERKRYFSAIGEMASWIAHEVRNPVFAISSTAKLINKYVSDKQLKKFSESIIKESERINSLVNDLLDYGKPLELHTKQVDLREFLNSYVQELYLENVKVEFISDSQREYQVMIDRERFLQVLTNLINNAKEAGATEITISLERSEEYVIVSIKDNGSGIKEEHLSMVFTPFFTTKKSGTGLGLAICKKIIEEHGGKIHVSSQINVGTEIRLFLKEVSS